MRNVTLLLAFVFALLSAKAAWSQLPPPIHLVIESDTGSTDILLSNVDSLTLSPSAPYTRRGISFDCGGDHYGEFASDVRSLRIDQYAELPVLIVTYSYDPKPHDTFTLAGHYWNLRSLDSIVPWSWNYDSNLINFSETSHSSSGRYFSVSCRSVDWGKHFIFTTWPARMIVLDSNLHPILDSIIGFESQAPDQIGPYSVELSANEERAISVSSAYSDISVGSLMETTLSPLHTVVLDTFHVSSAHYLPGTDDIIFFSYGSYSPKNPIAVDAGFYRYSRATGTRELLLHWPDAEGASEMINGFDVSPDGKRLMIPLHKWGVEDKLVEFSLETGRADTLLVSFTPQLPGFMVRYNHTGDALAITRFPGGVFSLGTAAPYGGCAILDLRTFQQASVAIQLFDRADWLSVCPRWSPDDQHLVFCSSSVYSEPPGSVGPLSPTVIKSLNR